MIWTSLFVGWLAIQQLAEGKSLAAMLLAGLAIGEIVLTARKRAERRKEGKA